MSQEPKMSSSVLHLSQPRTTRNRPKPDLPRDARDAAAQGFDVGGASFEFEDDFTGPSTMVRRGTFDVCGPGGRRIELPFTANFKFDKPYSEIADLEDLYERSVDLGEPQI